MRGGNTPLQNRETPSPLTEFPAGSAQTSCTKRNKTVPYGTVFGFSVIVVHRSVSTLSLGLVQKIGLVSTVFPFAIYTSICRRIVTICSGLQFLIGIS